MLTATLILAVGNDGRYLRFYQVIGRPDLGTDARFARNADRVRHRATLVPLLAAEMKRRPRRDWLEALEAATVPCGPINDLADVFADPQVQSRGMWSSFRIRSRVRCAWSEVP